MEEKLLQILIQGGLASVALSSLFVTYKIVSNHLSHLAEALKKLEVTMARTLQFLEDQESKK